MKWKFNLELAIKNNSKYSSLHENHIRGFLKWPGAKEALNAGNWEKLFRLYDSPEEFNSIDAPDILAIYLKKAGIDFEDDFEDPRDWFISDYITYIDYLY